MKPLPSNRTNDYTPPRTPIAHAIGLAVLVIAGLGRAQAAEPADAGAEATATGATVELDKVVVSGTKTDAPQSARDALNKIPGTVSVVDNLEVEKGRAANLEDVLAYQPGVFAAATGGNGANFVSIRGSGINTFYGGYARGIRYLYDGASISGPGGTQETFLTPTGVNYTEVINGSNAFSYGALALGGAINFVTHTGQSSPGTYLGIEGGSYGYRKYLLSHGGASADGATDYYVAVSKNERDGFQQRTPNSGKDIVLNLGHDFSSQLHGQLTLRYRKESYFNGGYLTLAQIRDNPRQASPNPYGRDNWSALAVGRLDYTIDESSRLELSLGFNKFDLDNGVDAAWYNDWPSTYISPQIRYLRTHDRLFGLDSDTTVVLNQTRLVPGNTYGGSRVDGQKVYTYRGRYSGSRDTSRAVGNDLHLNQDVTLTTGLSAVEVLRDIRVVDSVVANNSGYPDRVRYDRWYWVPRLGVSWKLTPETQLFSSVGRSIDPPVTWGIGPYNRASGVYVRSVTPQKGTTLEAGLRTRSERWNGSLAVYRTWLHDELHSIVVSPATATTEAVTDTVNASPTIHQGIEAALDARLWAGEGGDSLNLRQAYNYSDFFFRHDDDLGDNKLPGLPRQTYQAELEWKGANGLYAGVDVRAVSSYYIDYTNSLKLPSYSIWGLRLGYEAPGQKWKAYVDLRNLADKRYAVAGSASYDYGGSDAAAFWPGDGRSVFVGVGLRF